MDFRNFSDTNTTNPVTSNTTTAFIVDSANDFNQKTFYLRIPTIVFLSFLMPIGILGNVAVIYIFGFCTKRSNVQFFVVILAVFDIMSCLIGVPLELVEMIYMHTYPTEGLCKLQRLINYTCGFGSALVLLSISIERYTKVCRPHGRQMTPSHCQALALVILIVSMPLATPIAISYDRHLVQVKGNITVHQCAFHYSPETFMYYICVLPVCVAVFITMLILYSCVLRSAVLHYRKIKVRRQAKNQSNKTGHVRMISRTSSAVICLTMFFGLSFTPTLVIGIISKNYTDVDFTSPMQVAMILLYRSWVMNSSLNPIIYGFFNTVYRDTFLNMMARILCLRLAKTQKTQTKEFSSLEKDFASTSGMDMASESTLDRRRVSATKKELASYYSKGTRI